MRTTILVLMARPIFAQECLTAGHVAATAVVTYSQWCCVNQALLVQNAFVGTDGATIDDFVDLYVTIDNGGSVPVWPTSTYLIANDMRFEYRNDTNYFYATYSNVSYAGHLNASIFSLGNDHPSGQATGNHTVTMRGYALGCAPPTAPPPGAPPPPPAAPPPAAPAASPPAAPPPEKANEQHNDIARSIVLFVVLPTLTFVGVLLCLWYGGRACYRPRRAHVEDLATRERTRLYQTAPQPPAPSSSMFSFKLI